jgi:hypothetical protein
MHPMKRRVMTVLLGTFVTLGGCAGGNNVVAAVERPKLIQVVDVTQRRIAVHEMAHAVVVALLFDAEDIESVHVHASRCLATEFDPELCCDLTNTSHGGTVNRDEDWFEGGIEHRRRLAILYLAGGVADRLISGIDPEEFDGIDAPNVDKQIAAIKEFATRQGPASRFSGRPRNRWNEARERAELLARTEAIVAANEGVIRELAERLMAVPPDGAGRRLMDGDAFRAATEGLRLVDPSKTRKRQRQRTR